MAGAAEARGRAARHSATGRSSPAHTRWQREYPARVDALLRDGSVIEDAQTKAKRLIRERREREAAYSIRLADEARQEHRPEDESRYRQLTDCFLEGFLESS
jgi:hypothetical protein